MSEPEDRRALGLEHRATPLGCPTCSDCMLQMDEPPVRLQLLPWFSFSDQATFLVNTIGTPPPMHKVLTGRDGQTASRTGFLETPDAVYWPLRTQRDIKLSSSLYPLEAHAIWGPKAAISDSQTNVV